MTEKRVLRNASWIVGCKILQSGLAVLINAITARYFGPTNFGLISYAASLVAFVTPLASLGVSDIIVNELITFPEQEGALIGTSIIMTFLSSLCCIGGLCIFSQITNPNDGTATTVIVLYSLLLLSQSFELIQYWFHARLLSKYVSVVSFLAYLCISAYKVFLLIEFKNICWFAVSNCLDYLLISIGLFLVYKHKGGQRLRFSGTVAKGLWDKGKHYILPGVMGLMLAQSDRIMLRFLCGDTEVGFYSAALGICGMSSFVFSAIITSFRPAILEKKKRSQEEYAGTFIDLYRIVAYLSLAQILVLTFVPQVITLLYGQAYNEAVPILRIVVWYTAFSYIGGIRAVWILAENQQKYLFPISFYGVLMNIVLNLVMIPQFQGTGAAIATVITQIFTNLVIVYWVKPLRINIHYLAKGLCTPTTFMKRLRD